MFTPINPPSFINLNDFLQKLVDDNNVPGLIFLLYKQGKIEFLQKYGWQDIENKIPIEFDTIFRIYSMTKPIITIGLMMLFEEEKFKLEDPITKFLPEFKATKVFVKEEDGKIITEELEREITFLDLFTHTAGLGYGFYDDTIDKIYTEKMTYDKMKSLSLEEAVKIIADIPLRFQPGKYFRYSYSIDVLGRLIEILSGQSLDIYLKEKIFQPLEMNNTSFYVPENKLHKFAKVYLYKEGKPLQLVDTPNVSERFSEIYKLLSGGGGLVSTLHDYFNFTLLFYNKGKFKDKQLLQLETMDLITTNYFRENKSITDYAISKEIVEGLELHAYGQGLGIRVRIKEDDTHFAIGEHGWGGAATTYYCVDSQNDVIGLFMTQVFAPTISISVVDAGKLMSLAYEGLVE